MYTVTVISHHLYSMATILDSSSFVKYLPSANLCHCSLVPRPSHYPVVDHLQYVCTLLLVCHSSYGPTINGRLLADCTNYTWPVEIASGKGHA